MKTKIFLFVLLLSVIGLAQSESWLIECDITNANLSQAQTTLETIKTSFGSLVDNAEVTGANSHTLHLIILCPNYTEAVNVFSNLYSTYGARFNINTYIFRYKR